MGVTAGIFLASILLKEMRYLVYIRYLWYWVIPENIHTAPTEEIGVNPHTPFRCPNTFTIIRNNFFSPLPPDGRNFLCGGSMDLFWNDPLAWDHGQS
jgi:hypothetical protein